MSDLIHVGMADFKLCTPPKKICTIGLGSCLGVVLYDRSTKKCGLAHVMLPDSTRISNNSNRMKFMDTCLSDMWNMLLKNGIKRQSVKAKIAGGAKMFSTSSSHYVLNIGEQNVKAAKDWLKKEGIPLVSEDVGNSYGRTIIFDPSDENLLVKSVGKGEAII